MKKVLVTIPHGNVKDTFMPKHVCRYLEQFFDVDYNETSAQYTTEELKNLLPGYDAVITGWGTRTISGDTAGDRLKLIVHTGGTVANLVDDSTYRRGITVLSGNRHYAESVAEGTIAYILTAQRRIPDYISSVRNGGWRTEASVWEGLLGKTVGIVGMGTISRLLIPLLVPFRVKIKYFSHYPVEKEFEEKYGLERVSIEELFSTSDIVTVHSALNTDNRGLIGKELFALLKDNALFVNTSRGDVIDEDALIEALKENRFRALIDVYHKEPLPDDSPLRTLPNVYPIPHMAGPTLDLREHITHALIDDMVRFFNGEKHPALEITREMSLRMTKH